MNYWENTGKLREKVDVERTEEVVPELLGSRNYYTVFPECCPVERLRWRMARSLLGSALRRSTYRGRIRQNWAEDDPP